MAPQVSNYWLTRLVFQRGLGLIYLIAFICALNQFRPLVGERGLLPAPAFMRQVPFRDAPSLFYLAPKDWAFAAAAWIGILLSALAAAGVADRYYSWTNALVWFGIWLLYLSFVNVGQTFYGFGWESILLDAGFLAIFLGARHVEPPAVVLWLIRWLTFRVMFGAGLIKLRGDPCWRSLTCLNYHYETQPMPNPVSWFLHTAPEWTRVAGVAFNHFAELAAPFLLFLPQPFASIGAAIVIVFQFSIFVSGNLSWLNALTMVLAVSAVDGRWFGRLTRIQIPALTVPSPGYRIAVVCLGILIGALSIRPIMNMLSPRQIMNTAFDPLHLVGTYGAFGSITRQRYEVVVEGTEDTVLTAATHWKEYEFKGKPNDPARIPAQIAPYHLRLDWLMWFAAMSNYYEQPWFVNMMAKLLENDKPLLGLLKSNPFPERPPTHVRALLFEYHFANAETHGKTGQWWVRTLAGDYCPVLSLDDPAFRQLLQRQGWL